MNRTSKLFWPVLVTPKNALSKNTEATSRSQKLMTELGLIKSSNNGTFQVLPLAQRALDKCIDLVNHHMRAVDGQKLSLPVLTSAALWKKTGRLDGDITEFYIVRDRHGKENLLSPTHEEAITAMLASVSPISYRQLPLRLYQIGPKFRDELKARFGLLRAKEFLMKDMYTFDRTLADARITYEQVNDAYRSLFRQLQIPYAKVEADTGMMGGNASHEYHFMAPTGEDKIVTCSCCDYAANVEVAGKQSNCPECNASNSLEEVRGIEIGHAFQLGDRYSKPLGATFLQTNGKPQHLVMGCYGIGISRLMAAALEVLSTENELRWPKLITPFDVCIIGPKEGSKEQQLGEQIEAEFCNSLKELVCPDDVLYDDRKYLTIGKRLLDAKKMGYPMIVVIGSKVLQETSKLELHVEGNIMELESNEVLKEINKYQTNKIKLFNCTTLPRQTSTKQESVISLSC